MEFLAGSFLWALPLLGVPVLLHLLNRRRQQVVRWGAMRFLLEAIPRKRRRWRIEDLLLLALRTALVLLAVLIFAQPQLRLGAWLGGGSRDIVIVLDTSLSTAVSAGQQSVFDHQRKAAEEFVNRLAADDRVRVLTASLPPEWLVAEPVRISGSGRRNLLGRLSEFQPGLGRADLRKALHQAIEAEPTPGTDARLIAVFADDQMQSWDPRSASAWNAVRDRAESSEHAAAIHVQLFRKEGPVTNRCVDSVSAVRTTVPVGDPIVLTANIRNTADRPAPAAVARLTVAGALVSTATIAALEPAQSTQASFTQSFDAPGVYRCAVQIEGSDDLPLDNEAQVVIEVVDHVRLLIADGAPGGNVLEGSAGYLLAALGQGGKTIEQTGARVFRPTVVPAFELSEDMARRYSCVVLVNVSTLTADVMRALQDQVRNGAGVWIVAGGQTNAEMFNKSVYAFGRGLSPGSLGKVVGDATQREQFERFRPPAANHAATRLLADVDRLDIDKVQIFARFALSDLTEQQRSATLLGTDKGEPVVIEKQVAGGRIILQAIPLDLSWSNLPISQAFVVMAHEWLWYLLEPSQTRWNISPGEPFTASFEPDAYAATASVILPSGERTAVGSVLRGGRRVYRSGKTLRPGSCQLVVTDAQGNQSTLPFQVNRDPAESGLTGMTQDDEKALVAGSGVHMNSDPLSLKAPARQLPPRPIWSWLMLGAAAALLGETILSAWMARRRAPVSAEAHLVSGMPLPDGGGAMA